MWTYLKPDALSEWRWFHDHDGCLYCWAAHESRWWYDRQAPGIIVKNDHSNIDEFYQKS